MINPNNSPWWTKAVIYEVYVDKFAGNFQGLTEKIDYLTYLGVNTVWLLPHYPSPMIDGGYDISDYFSVREDLGDLNDFKNFLTAAHNNGLKVITDLVLNHTSDLHPWFSEARKSRNNSRRDYYIWSPDDSRYSQAFVHFADIKKNNWIYNDATKDYYYATFYPQQPDLNWDNSEVYTEMLKVMEFWLSIGVDGFRLDAVSRLAKRDNTNCFALPETHQILKRIRADISAKFPEALFMAESGGWPYEAKSFFGSGDECQMVINFPLSANLLASIPDADLKDVQSVLYDSGGIPVNCDWGVFLTNHDSVDLFFLADENKKFKLSHDYNLLSKFGHKDGSGFAARLAEICGGDKNKIIWAYRQLFDLPGVPILYYGNEIGMLNSNFKIAPADTREYVRGSFDWYEAGKQIKDADSILNGVRNIILNRKIV